MDARERGVPTVVAENVQVRYTVGTNDPSFRSSGLQRIGDRLLGRQGRTTVRALRGVSIVANEGEMIGVVGANGSGKSTFLRTLAGVEQPDRGRILARYQPVLLGVHASLQQTLSGSENVRLGCLAMGLAPNQLDAAYQFVVELSALGSAIHRPMETYSSGMSSRLRFAIALAARPRILLIDEALSTGDATFAERSSSAMNDMLDDAGTVFLVNHAAKVIQEMCSRAVWMHRGELIMDGPAESVAEKYRWWAWNVAKNKSSVADKLLADVVRTAQFDEINVLDPDVEAVAAPRHATRLRPNRKRREYRLSKRMTAEQIRSDDLGSRTSEAPPTGFEPGSEELEQAPVRTPALPKPAFDQVAAGTMSTANPVRYRPGSRPIILRPADIRDSAIAAASRNRPRLRVPQGRYHGSLDDSSRNTAE
ncbi:MULTISPECIES: ABC transporter ATP-binding protein [unclassified Brevibacterium]|uniref:ABC transporter ATP-binding protein n=1 Tax=unclassified Brevibacterium TaxID=2614124 RepID=UPI0010F8D7E0|nr:ABC transporter ATP-binding protein [Brevibacterium sp. 2SA]